MWSTEAVDGDTQLDVPPGIGVELDGRVGRVMLNPLLTGEDSHVPVRWDLEDSKTEFKLKPRDLKRGSPEEIEVTKSLSADKRKLVVSKFTETLPHGLKFVCEDSSELPELTFCLDRVHESPDRLVLLHQPEPGAEWETLRNKMHLSLDGKRVSVRIDRFCVSGVQEVRRHIISAQIEEVQIEELEADLDELEALEEQAPEPVVDAAPKSDAFFAAFAQPEIVPGARPFFVEVTAFSRGCEAEAATDSVDRGKARASARNQHPMSIPHGAEVSIQIVLSDTPFTTEQSVKTVIWNGEYSTAAFKLRCGTPAKAGLYACEAQISSHSCADSIELAFELNVAETRSPAASEPSSPAPELVQMHSSTTHVDAGLMTTLSNVSRELQAQVEQSDAEQTGQTDVACPTGSSGFHIFLSYRRIDADKARSVKQALVALGYSVFMDITPDGLGAGDFQSQLERHLKSTPVVIALFTATLNVDGAVEFLRIKNSGDFVRLELRAALHMEKLLIPLYTSAAPGTPAFDIGAMVWGANLPADVADIGKQNMVELSTNFFDASIAKPAPAAALLQWREQNEMIIRRVLDDLGPRGILRYHLFLGHRQRGGGSQVGELYEIWKSLGVTCWRDLAQIRQDTTAMIRGVAESSVYTLYLTNDALSQYVLLEAWAAMKLEKPVIVLVDNDSRKHSYAGSSVEEAIEGWPQDLID